MDSDEREVQKARIKQYDVIEDKLYWLAEAARRIDVDGAYELDICGCQLSRLLFGNEFLDPIRQKIRFTIYVQIMKLREEQKKI